MPLLRERFFVFVRTVLGKNTYTENKEDEKIEYLKILYTSAFSVLTLFILCKLMGKRQISQLSMFDYINGISIGSIAAEMSSKTDDDPLLYVTAMCVYAFLSILITWLSSKSIMLRKIFEGNSLLMFKDNVLYRNNFKRAKLDLNEFLSLLRIKGYYDLSKLQTVILETNGQLSVQTKADDEPIKRSDLDVSSIKNGISYNIILDGNLMLKSLTNAGITEERIREELKKGGYTEGDVFLATYEKNSDKLNIFRMNNEPAEEITS